MNGFTPEYLSGYEVSRIFNGGYSMAEFVEWAGKKDLYPKWQVAKFMALQINKRPKTIIRRVDLSSSVKMTGKKKTKKIREKKSIPSQVDKSILARLSLLAKIK